MQQPQPHHPHQQQPQLSSPMFGAPQASLPSTNVSTEQIQKLLEENKRLILAILENQNQGKLAECAQYQSQLQKNLMYLAAIADAQSHTSGGSATPTQMIPQPTISQGHSMQQHPQSGISHSPPPQQSQPLHQLQPPQQSQLPQQSQPPQPPQQSHPQQPQLQPQRQPQLQQQLQPLQAQPGAFPPQMLFQLGAFQPHDQQQISSYLQQQQAMMGSMGMRMGANNGIHPAMFSGLVGAATNQMDPHGRHDTGAGPSDSRGMSSGQGSGGGGGNRES